MSLLLSKTMATKSEQAETITRLPLVLEWTANKTSCQIPLESSRAAAWLRPKGYCPSFARAATARRAGSGG